MTAAERILDDPATVARRLLGTAIESLEPVGGGRNSRVYCVHSGSQKFALKRYPSREDDPRDRLGTEMEALRLMDRHVVPNVPKSLAIDPASNFALLSWLEGVPVNAVGDADIDQAVDFLSTLHHLRTTADVGFHRLAAEACLSGSEVEGQIRRRLVPLQQAAGGENDLNAFLQNEFNPALTALLAGAKQRMQASSLDFTAVLPQERRTLVPSDFGFHNSLRRPDGTLVFFDFEYFGWDDPVKLTADILHHPGTPVAARQRTRFRNAALEVYRRDDVNFPARLQALYPLFGLRWTLILLNEFLPSRWRLRVSAGETESWAEAKARQLSRARELLARVINEDEGSAYGQ
jgi:hypothetical protein